MKKACMISLGVVAGVLMAVSPWAGAPAAPVKAACRIVKAAPTVGLQAAQGAIKPCRITCRRYRMVKSCVPGTKCRWLDRVNCSCVPVRGGRWCVPRCQPRPMIGGQCSPNGCCKAMVRHCRCHPGYPKK